MAGKPFTNLLKVKSNTNWETIKARGFVMKGISRDATMKKYLSKNSPEGFRFASDILKLDADVTEEQFHGFFKGLSENTELYGGPHIGSTYTGKGVQDDLKAFVTAINPEATGAELKMQYKAQATNSRTALAREQAKELDYKDQVAVIKCLNAFKNISKKCREDVDEILKTAEKDADAQLAKAQKTLAIDFNKTFAAMVNGRKARWAATRELLITRKKSGAMLKALREALEAEAEAAKNLEKQTELKPGEVDDEGFVVFGPENKPEDGAQ